MPLSRSRLGPEAAAVPFREPLGDREAEPGAAALVGRRPKEGLEDSLELRLGNAGAAINNAHERLAPSGRHAHVNRARRRVRTSSSSQAG